jgi:hypothetical protein
LIVVSQSEIRDTAVKVVCNWYKSRGWRTIVKKSGPYDVVAIKKGWRKYIEVKGSMNKPKKFRALLSKNQKKYINDCKRNGMHYEIHIVTGIGRYKRVTHKKFPLSKIKHFEPTGSYYTTLDMKSTS